MLPTLSPLALCLALAAPLAADTLHVPADHATIPDALAAAADGDTVLVAPGTYVGPLVFDKRVLLMSAEGPAATILDGDGGPLVSAEGLIGAGAGVVGFTLTGGGGLAHPEGGTRGGAVHVSDATFLVRRCLFIDNHVSGDGGAVFASANVQRPLHVLDSRFVGNSAGGRGGAVALQGVVFGSGSHVSGNDFRHNHADGHGGALWVSANRSPTLQRNHFHHNRSEGSGGGAALSIQRTALPGFSTFTHNSAALDGGAVAVWVEHLPVTALPMNLQFTSLRALDNSAGRHGGALWIDAVLGVAGNDLAFKDGIGVYDSLFVRNHAVVDGGVLHKRLELVGTPPVFAAPRVLLDNCTLVDNSSEQGADVVRSESTLEVPPVASQLIVRGVADSLFAGEVPVLSFSDVEGGFPGEGNFDADPQFLDPAHDVYALRSTSPARGAGPDGADLGFTPYSPFADHGRSLPGEWAHPVLEGVVVELTSGAVSFTLDLEFARPGATAFLVLGFDDAYAPFKQGVLVPRPDVISAPFTLGVHPVSGSGWLQLPNNVLPTMLARERSTFVQFWFDDPAAPAGLAASNALSLTTPTEP